MYDFIYENENEFKQLERGLRQIDMSAYKKLMFEIYPNLKRGVLNNAKINGDFLEIELPTYSLSKNVYGTHKLIFQIVDSNIKLIEITPKKILLKGNYVFYRGVKIPFEEENMRKFQIDLLMKCKEDNTNKMQDLFDEEIELIEEKKELEFSFDIDNCFNGNNFKKFLSLLPYYKVEYENNYTIINKHNIKNYKNNIKKYKDNIKKYTQLFQNNFFHKNLEDLYKNTHDKVIDCFIVECDKKYFDKDLSDIEKIAEIKKGLPIKNLYSDEELTMMLYKNEQENIGYFNNKFINNELYECLKDLHIKYGYIYVSKDIEQQKEQIETYKNKIPIKLYVLLNQIIKKSITKYDFDFYITDIIEITPDHLNDKIIAPSHFLISYFLNCYFGKQEDNKDN